MSYLGIARVDQVLYTDVKFQRYQNMTQAVSLLYSYLWVYTIIIFFIIVPYSKL